jgi:predicted small lipoprotein YifL
MNQKNKYLLLTGIIVFIALAGCNRHLPLHLPEEMNGAPVQAKTGLASIPEQRKILWNIHSAFADSIIRNWSDKPLPDWKLKGKVDAPRIFLAKLLTQKDIAATNEAIMHDVPNGITGSTWALNKKGDYDFTLTILTTILWLYGDSSSYIYPETKDHLLKVLLTEEGNKFRYSAPKTLGLAPETENHILMTEGSRYLKNRWIMLHGNSDAYYDNVQNGMEDKLLSDLYQLETKGLYEFNSLPYTGYTITALLNLEAFASEKLRKEARKVLDYINWCYALGSYQLKHYPPMRRRYEKASFQNITADYHSIFMKSWVSYSSIQNFSKMIDGGTPHALMGACMPYRPADAVVNMLFDKGNGYFVKMGHGASSCPEIYSAGKHFLISAGGTNRGKSSLILPRPICLFLNDSAEKLSSVIHLSGPGTDYMQWNNTGVYKNFACAAGPVFIPFSWKPVTVKDNWSVYSLKDGITVAVFSTDNFGLIAMFEGNLANSLQDELITANPSAEKLLTEFHFPDGRKITYDVNAPKNKWVITSSDNQVTDRNFDQWPLIDGDYKKLIN